MSIFILILGVVLFVGLVVAHEFGHFIMARRGGVEVEEFGIGFPPKVYGRKIKTGKSAFEFTINALPLGGFVRLKGENDAADAPGTFGAASLSTKVKVMVAGVVVNLLIAIGLFTLLALIGMPKLINNQFTVASDTKISRDNRAVAADQVDKDQPAGKAGLQTGDVITSFAGTDLKDRTQLGDLSKANAGKTVPLVVDRDGQTKTLSVKVNSENTGNGYIGVTSLQKGIQLQRSTYSAPVVAVGLTAQLTQLTFKGLGTAIASIFQGEGKKASEQVSGPVGIAVILKEGSKIGVNFILFIVAILSLSLAIMNVLPIPALDGGRLFVLLLFRALKKPLTKQREEAIHGTGFMALILLFIVITVVDVKRFF